MQKKILPIPLWTITLTETIEEIHNLDHIINYFTHYNEINSNSKQKLKQIEIYLEKGNSSSGLIHILERHAEQFTQKFNVAPNEISDFIKNIILNGNYNYFGYTLKESKINKKLHLAIIYQIDCNKFLRVAIGKNGYIVSAVPQSYNNDVKRSIYN
ncbi:hypothetical protein ABK040_015215 [Willaertia magna]